MADAAAAVAGPRGAAGGNEPSSSSAAPEAVRCPRCAAIVVIEEDAPLTPAQRALALMGVDPDYYSGGGGGTTTTAAQPQPPAEIDTFRPCAFNLTKVILGAGMMAFPRAMYVLGAIPGVALMIAVAGLTYFSLAAGLVDASLALRARSYSELARRALGRRAAVALQLAVFVTCWVMEVVFLVVIGDVLCGEAPEFNGLIRQIVGDSIAIPSRAAVLSALCALVLLPLGLLRSMEHLAFLNVVGVASNALLAALMAALLAAAARAGAAALPPLWPRWDELVAAAGGSRAGAARALAATLPILLNGFACHQSLHPLLPSLRPFSCARAKQVVGTSIAAAGTLYLVISLCACAVFGDGLHDDVLADVSAPRLAALFGAPALGAAAALAVRLGYLASLTGSFVLLLFPLRQVLADVLHSCGCGGGGAGGGGTSGGGGGGFSSGGAPPKLDRAWAPLTALLAATALATACGLPGIWDALSLVGATATTAQAWILPSLILMAVELRPRGGKGKGSSSSSAAAGAGAGAAAAAAAAASGSDACLLEPLLPGEAAPAEAAPLPRRSLGARMACAARVLLALATFLIGCAMFGNALADEALKRGFSFDWPDHWEWPDFKWPDWKWPDWHWPWGSGGGT